MIVRDLEEEALRSAAMHLVGQSRAFVQQLEGVRHEIGSLHDERTSRVLEALDVTLREPAGPGTLREVERAATELLRALQTDEGR